MTFRDVGCARKRHFRPPEVGPGPACVAAKSVRRSRLTSRKLRSRGSPAEGTGRKFRIVQSFDSTRTGLAHSFRFRRRIDLRTLFRLRL